MPAQLYDSNSLMDCREWTSLINQWCWGRLKRSAFHLGEKGFRMPKEGNLKDAQGLCQADDQWSMTKTFLMQ